MMHAGISSQVNVGSSAGNDIKLYIICNNIIVLTDHHVMVATSLKCNVEIIKNSMSASQTLNM